MLTTTVSVHEARQLATVKTFARHILGAAGVDRREREIAQLPSKVWRGEKGDQSPHRVFAIVCHGDRGNGPHLLFKPESFFWSLADVHYFVCPPHTS